MSESFLRRLYQFTNLIFLFSLCIFKNSVLSSSSSKSIIVQFFIDENKPRGTIVGNLATKVSFKPDSFEMIKYGGRGSIFKLEKKTGKLLINRQLDREEIDCKKSAETCVVTMLVQAVPRDVYLTVQITIGDENDNSPIFDVREKIIKISEDVKPGEIKILPVAEDADTQRNGITNYRMAPANAPPGTRTVSNFQTIKQYFEVFNETKGGRLVPKLRVIKPLDRETYEKFHFNLEALDSGHHSAAIKIIVKVTDVNDNSPIWRNEPYRKRVNSCQGNGELFKLTADDRDDNSIEHGIIKFSLSEHSREYKIAKQLVYISDNALMSSQNGFHAAAKGRNQIEFEVLATDGGGKSSSTKVTLDIDDCNDYQPSIKIRNTNAEVYENSAKELIVSYVDVSDGDNGMNAEFTCHLKDALHFTLNKIPSGVDEKTKIYSIKTRKDAKFDREDNARYSDTITCTDKGHMPKTSSSRFSFTVLDVNDNTPKFPKSFERFTLKENLNPNAHIGSVKASDKDAGKNGTVKYMLKGRDSQYFNIGPFGSLSSSIQFDRERRDSYSFDVIATDQGVPALSSSVSVIVSIEDVNDCKPEFQANYVFEVVESDGRNTRYQKFGRLNATDADLGRSGMVVYSLDTAPDPSNPAKLKHQRYFNINERSGDLTIRGVVDRERFSKLYAVVVAKDSGIRRSHSSSTTVTVHVLDLNDNSPSFVFPNATHDRINVSTDASQGTIVAQILAVDPDREINGTVNYSIVANHNSLYMIYNDGKLILSKPLDKSTLSRNPAKIIIKAFDGGKKSKSNIATLWIQYITPTYGTAGGQRVPGINKNGPNPYDPADGGLFSGSSLTVLYGLAAVVFVVFVAVLAVLIFLYIKSRSEDRNGISWKFGNRDGTDDRNTQRQFAGSGEDSNTINALVRDGTIMLKGKSMDTTAVCVFNDQENSYTHLAMPSSRAATYGYMPAAPSHYATYSAYSPNAIERRRHLASSSSTDKEANSGGYETCLWTACMDPSVATAASPTMTLRNQVSRGQQGFIRQTTRDTDNMLTSSQEHLSVMVHPLNNQQGHDRGGSKAQAETDPFLPPRGGADDKLQRNLDAKASVAVLHPAHSYAFLDSFENRSAAGAETGDKLFRHETNPVEPMKSMGSGKSTSNLSSSKAIFKSSPYVTSSFV